ncbi:MAG: DegV family protein [Anaerolineae bacterium]|nr:DegV family protein [Anaerolineae bacterium]
MSQVIKVITDSVCDIPPEVAAALDITQVPAVVNIGAQSYLDDGVQLTREEFYRRLPMLRELPTTSGCPLGLVEQAIRARAAEADHLILITAPAQFSHIYSTFRTAAEALVPGRYTLIDSHQITMGEGFLVLAAAEGAANGVPLAEIVAHLEDMRARIHIFGVLSTLDNLRKSGRVGWIAALAGTLLNIKPVLELTQGEVDRLALVRSHKQALKRLVEIVSDHAPLERLAVLHTDYPVGAQRLLDQLADLMPPQHEVLAVNLNPALGTHLARAGLGVALLTERKRTR